MKASAILAYVLAAFLLVDSALAGGNHPRSGRYGKVLVGYIYTRSGWQFHVDLAHAHPFAGPGYGMPRQPVPTLRTALPVVYGGVYGPYGYCRHGVVYLTQGPPTIPGGVFPNPPGGVFPPPHPPLPPITLPPIISTNLPVRVIRTVPPRSVSPLTPPAQAVFLEAHRLRNPGSGTRPPPPAPLNTLPPQ
jgi:hypothetical protein